MDTYPRRENRALNFRFFVVLPYDAIPLDKRISKPLLTQRILTGHLIKIYNFFILEILQTQISELTHGLGWHVIRYFVLGKKVKIFKI